MNSFKQKALISALVSAGAAVFAGNASAVYVNQDGLGQALVYPYYTVRGGNNTLLSVVNTTDQAKAVKVRFLEGKDSKEVLDFNLFLSPKDVWTGAIVATTDGAAIVTGDKSCTNPKIPAAGAAFRNFAYTTDASALQTLDRTREGYVELLEMATVPTATTLGKAVTHVNGAPPCSTNQSLVSDASVTAATGLLAPSGGLFGNGTILNASGGMSSGYDATAFDGWTASRPSITGSGEVTPNLGTGSSKVSVVTNGGNLFVASWANAIDAVSATIMHSAVLGEYAYTPDGVLGTDWVLTMPTKWNYVNVSTTALPPFQNIWDSSKGIACDDVSLTGYDREENTSSTPDDFSPRPPTGRNSLCYEATVISFGGGSISGSTNVANINPIQNGGATVSDPGKAGGWLELTFAYTGAKLVSDATSTVTTVSGATATVNAPAAQTYTGLPVIGFVLSSASYKSGNPQQNYSNSYSLRFRRNIAQ